MPIKCLTVNKKEMTRDGEGWCPGLGRQKMEKARGRVMPCSTPHPSGRPGRLTGKDGVFSAALPRAA